MAAVKHGRSVGGQEAEIYRSYRSSLCCVRMGRCMRGGKLLLGVRRNVGCSDRWRGHTGPKSMVHHNRVDHRRLKGLRWPPGARAGPTVGENHAALDTARRHMGSGRAVFPLRCGEFGRTGSHGCWYSKNTRCHVFRSRILASLVVGSLVVDRRHPVYHSSLGSTGTEDAHECLSSPHKHAHGGFSSGCASGAKMIRFSGC